jgi:uncharacterized protein YmfQ (DUF2313 family)
MAYIEFFLKKTKRFLKKVRLEYKYSETKKFNANRNRIESGKICYVWLVDMFNVSRIRFDFHFGALNSKVSQYRVDYHY